MKIMDRWRRNRFAALAVRITRRTTGVERARLDSETFAVAAYCKGSPHPVWIYLDNAYRECAGASAAERREHLTRLARILTSDGPEQESWAEVRPKLRPVLRPATFGLAGPQGMVPPLSRPSLPFLRELVVIDMPESMAYVPADRLATWGVTPAEVFEAAHENLRVIASRAEVGDQPSSITRMIDMGDGYWTSLLLSAEWLAAVQRRTGHPMIVFVADTRSVLVAPLADSGMGAVYDMVEADYREAVRSLSPVGYVLDGDRVVPYAPPAGHPDHPAASRAMAILAAAEYGTQTDWLSTQYEGAGIDVFVAKLIVAGKPGRAPFTVATWTDGITSLLPQADFVAFVRDGAPMCLVPWQEVAERVGLEAEPLLMPARFRVESWPSDAVMAELRAVAAD